MTEPARDSATAPIHGRVLDLGRTGYQAAYDRQLELVGLRQADEIADTLVVVEHPHVITLGRSQKAVANVLAAGEVEVVQIERGGDVTYHGQGQLVAYPIFKLLQERGEQDLHLFLRRLEDAMIATLARHDIEGGRVEGKTGVWIDGSRKIASIGIACRKWVTFHGLALNVNTDLSYFGRINPCGFSSAIMTSMEKELGAAVDFETVKAELIQDLGTAFGRALEPRLS
ncbi:MAG: lipoyl(octanoyl) transferase LipB [Deltaproteobacteria bacterium]|nr:lipoyl(octanoyl) transferase LipB [Deltaproteobacteria bacterium]